MKTLLRYILFALLFQIIFYYGMTLIELKLNFFEWNKGTRMMFSLISTLTLILALLFHLMDKHK